MDGTAGRPTTNAASPEEVAAFRDRHEARFREATRRGFDGAKVVECLEQSEDEAVRLGVDFDQFLMNDVAADVTAASASLEAHKRRLTDLRRRVPRERGRQLSRRLDQVDREEGYRSQFVVVRELHADPTGRKVRDFLGARSCMTRMHRPVAAARARRPRRSSSSSRSSGTDPGDGDGAEQGEPAGLALPHGRRGRNAGGWP